MTLPAHAAAIVLVALDVLVRGWRARVLLSAGGGRVSLRRAIAINAYGDAASAVTPARLGGEPARLAGFRAAGVPLPATLLLLGTEKLVDWTLVSGVILALVLAFPQTSVQGLAQLVRRATTPTALMLVAGVVLVSVASVVLALRLRPRRARRAYYAVTDALGLAWQLLGSRPRVLAAAVGLTVVSMAARTAILPLLAGVGSTLPLASTLMGSFVLLYSQLFLPTPSGSGAVELGFVGGLAGSMSGVELAALLVSWRAYTLAPGILIAGLSGMRRIVRGAVPLAVPAAAVMLRLMVATLVAAVMTVGPAGAQEPAARASASRMLATDHWSYEYVRRLRERGYLADLNPLVQPYRRGDIARGLVSLDPDTLRPPIADWVRLLKDVFAPEMRESRTESPRWGGVVAGGGRASSSRRLDPARAVGDAGVWPRFQLGAWAERGPFVIEARLLGDNYLVDDPDGIYPMQQRGARSDHAYVSARAAGAEVVLGRFERNWAALGTRGLMVSDAPTPYPQLGVAFALGRVTLRAFTGELDTVLGQQRYLAAHRVEYAEGDLAVSVGEAIVYSALRGGPRLRYLNPVEAIFFDAEGEPTDVTVNVMLNAHAWYRRGPWVVFGEFLLDDIDVNADQVDRAPTRYGFALGSHYHPSGRVSEVALEYRQVSSFAYRTNRSLDQYSFLRRGLGDNYADYDRLTLSAEIVPPIRGLILTPALEVLRQGEGGVREPFPASYFEFLRSPALFIGVRETTYRAGLRGRYQPSRFFWVAWDVGQNWVSNADHADGADVSELAGVVEVGVVLESPLRRPR